MYKGNLTKNEAYKCMLEGKKVGREYFGSNEYIEIRDTKHPRTTMYFEDDISAYPEWWGRIEPTFSKSDDGKDWYVWKESKD